MTITGCGGGGSSSPTSPTTLSPTPSPISPPNTNSAPVASNDSQFNVTTGGTLNVVVSSGVLTNDSDADNDSLTAVLLQEPTNGSLILNSDGSFAYTHDGGVSTSDSFAYIANDGVANSNSATVSITIDPPPNTAPVAVNDDQFVVNNGDTLVVPVETGVLSNDSDTESDPLTAVLDQAPKNGTLSLNADGSFEYTHDGGSSTSDSFTYSANDGTDNSNVATVTISINAKPVPGDICETNYKKGRLRR